MDIDAGAGHEEKAPIEELASTNPEEPKAAAPVSTAANSLRAFFEARVFSVCDETRQRQRSSGRDCS